MNDTASTRQCECGWGLRAVRDEWFPVIYDETMGEYQLVLDVGDGRQGHARLRFCPWCGGAFPKSKRGTFFTSPTETDIADVRKKLKGVSTTDEMYAVLGEPSRIDKASWRDTFEHEGPWESLVLCVHVYNTTLNYTFYGRFRGFEQAAQSE